MLKQPFRKALKEKKKKSSNLLTAISEAVPAKKGSMSFWSPLPVERKGSIELPSALCDTLQEAQPILKLIWAVRGDHKVGNSWSEYKTIHKMSEKRK